MMSFLDHNFMKKVVAFIIVANVLFALIVLFIFYKIEEEPVVLIAAWFTFTTGQLGLTTILKKMKTDLEEGVKKNKKERKRHKITKEEE